MNKALFKIFFPLLALSVYAAPLLAGWDPDKAAGMDHDVKEAINNFKKQDPSINRFFEKAEGYAIYPSVGKAGMFIGGAYGEGRVYSKSKLIGDTTLKQLTVGFQLGAQAYSELIFFKDKSTLDKFKSEKIEFDAQVSAVAATFGASANVDYSHGVAVFTITKGGLMYEASVGGQQFTFDPK